jgi:hypothetical protein
VELGRHVEEIGLYGVEGQGIKGSGKIRKVLGQAPGHMMPAGVSRVKTRIRRLRVGVVRVPVKILVKEFII